MTRVYKMYHMTKSEAASAILFSLVVVLLYSFWGAHVLKNQVASATNTPVATTQQ